eukprot:3940533-Amphidinium_carterae.4
MKSAKISLENNEELPVELGVGAIFFGQMVVWRLLVRVRALSETISEPAPVLFHPIKPLCLLRWTTNQRDVSVRLLK